MGDDRTDVDVRDTDAILRNAGLAFPHLRDQEADMVRVGLRPYRSTVRLEVEQVVSGQRLVHNYGHGGSGYTVSWGCAEDVASIVLD